MCVADLFHVVRVANRCMDTVRRRVQNEQLGHRGRKRDPLFKIRKILLAGSERVTQGGADRMLLGLRAGDPNDELLGAWLARESVRDVDLTGDPGEAALLLDKTIAGCLADVVPEIRSLSVLLRAGKPTWPNWPTQPIPDQRQILLDEQEAQRASPITGMSTVLSGATVLGPAVTTIVVRASTLLRECR